MNPNDRYITIKVNPKCHQMTLEEMLFGAKKTYYDPVMTPTMTYVRNYIPWGRWEQYTCTSAFINALKQFNDSTQSLREIPRKDLYDIFCIPKKSGGLRKISAPKTELYYALIRLKEILESDDFVPDKMRGRKALYHTSAYAYVKRRSIVDAVKRHQENESYWFGKYDLHDFFGSTTLPFLMQMLRMVYPFSEVIRDPAGQVELEKALELAFLDGGLPQGTPLSPLLTNIMMIPIDHALANKLHSYNKQTFVYTRYADDFIISSKYGFSFREIENVIVETLASFNAPFTINSKKTRYGSRGGSNWNLGLMLNKDNQITVGSQRKRNFCKMLVRFLLDERNGVSWSLADVQHMEGLRSYYHMVEPETIDGMIAHINGKYNADLVKMIHTKLHPEF